VQQGIRDYSKTGNECVASVISAFLKEIISRLSEQIVLSSPMEINCIDAF
jgi:hypothetical protein